MKLPNRVRTTLQKWLMCSLLVCTVFGLSGCDYLFEVTVQATAELLGIPPKPNNEGRIKGPLRPLDTGSPGQVHTQQFVLRHSAATAVQPLAIPITPAEPMIAPFFGNLSAITLPSSASSGDFFVLQRQGDCSLTLLSYGAAVNSSNVAVVSPDVQVTHYEQTIHNSAFLSTTPDQFPSGCVDQSQGITSSLFDVLGIGKNGQQLLATQGTTNGVLTSGLLANGTYTFPVSQATDLLPTTMAGGDLNKDGNPDVVSINTDGLHSSVTVLLGKDDGTYQPGVNYPLPGSAAKYGVLDDLNGDGKLDLLVSSDFPTFAFSIFLGNGDGTFQPAQTFAPTGTNLSSDTAFITADVNGDGHKDIVTAAGLVFLGSGDGITWTQVSQPAFPPISTATNGFAPSIVSADFNKDGKLDLATDDGTTIRISLGNGDGTFTPGPAYAALPDFSFLRATDLDGDGNTDLWLGYGGKSIYQGEIQGLSYALMGNGDGTFQGAPSLPAPYTGQNLADLRDNGHMDLVGTSFIPNPGAPGTLVFTTSLGQSNGTFVNGPQLSAPPFIFNGTTTYPVSSADSYVVGDFNGDSIPDLIYIPAQDELPVAGYYLAIGVGDGSFATPTFIPAPTFEGAGDIDVNQQIAGIMAADFNHDGKLDIIYSFMDTSFNTHLITQGFAVQLGNGNATFQGPMITTTYSSLNAPTFAFTGMLGGVADVNKDNFPDVFWITPTTIVNFEAQHQVQLFLANGNGSFQTPSTLTLTGNMRSSSDGEGAPITVADLNGDGNVDLIAGGSSADGTIPEVAIALGNGNGTFQPATVMQFQGFGFLSAPAIADFDGDTKLDMFVDAGSGIYTSGIFPGLGNGSFQTISNGDGTVTPPQQIVLSAFGPGVAHDFNGDGKPDLIVGSVVLLNKNGVVIPPTLATTTTALQSSLNPSTVGASVTFTATVTSGTAGTITGTVTFFDGATSLGTGAVGAGGIATFPISSLAQGAHSITAHYGGDGNFGTSISTATNQVVNAVAAAATTTTLGSSLNPSTSGQSVTFTATVTSGAGTPTGSVTFFDGVTSIGSGTLNGSAHATLMTSSLSVAPHSITAMYVGNASFASSTSLPVNQVVNAAAAAATTTTLGSSLNPSTSGQSVTFTAAVTSGGGTPTGTVTFFDGATSLGNGTLNGSAQATLMTSTLSVASHSITAMYVGNSSFAASTSLTLTQVVNAVASSSFSFSLGSNSISLDPGQRDGIPLTVTYGQGFTQRINFTCTGAIPGGSCGVNPSFVTMNAPGTTVDIVTSGNAAAGFGGRSRNPSDRDTRSDALLLLGFAVLSSLVLLRRQRRAQIAVSLALFVMLVLVGCADLPGAHTTPAGTYHVTVTGTAASGSPTSSQVVTLQVN